MSDPTFVDPTLKQIEQERLEKERCERLIVDFYNSFNEMADKHTFIDWLNDNWLRLELSWERQFDVYVIVARFELKLNAWSKSDKVKLGNRYVMRLFDWSDEVLISEFKYRLRDLLTELFFVERE